MVILMGAVLLAILFVGTAALAGHPLLTIAVGAALGGVVLALARRRPRRTVLVSGVAEHEERRRDHN